MNATPPASAYFPSRQLQALVRRLRAWRTRPSRGRRIPEPLWKAAAELARDHGLSATASALKLNYYDLQRRLRTEQAPDGEPSAGPQFVQLSPLGSGDAASQAGTIELLRPTGGRVIVRLPAASPRQLLPLVQAILRA